jgi:hypothetical protein
MNGGDADGYLSEHGRLHIGVLSYHDRAEVILTRHKLWRCQIS